MYLLYFIVGFNIFIMLITGFVMYSMDRSNAKLHTLYINEKQRNSELVNALRTLKWK